MYIKKIKIENFRAFSKKDEVYEIELGTKLTCISGHNGIGKSTILAMLSNCAEIKKKDGELLNGDAFRGDYSDIIKYDKIADSSGRKCTIFFDDLPRDEKGNILDGYLSELSFRATTQKLDEANFRYRLIPIKDENKKDEKKISWPVYYLGLSRLFPFGEADAVEQKTIKENNYKNMIIQEYNDIFTLYGVNSEAEFIQPNSIKRKKGVGIITEKYGSLANSSGQDNLGQILAAVFSFQRLKDNQKDCYHGGILLIDEIDATLHPAAQYKLFDFLYKKSKELDLQIVFTTHSLSLMEHICKKELNEQNNYCIIQYLRNVTGKIEIIKNPTMSSIHADLMVEYKNRIINKEINVFMEDDVSRWFLKGILKNTKIKSDLNFLDGKFGFVDIVKLVVSSNIFKDALVILDPDVKRDESKHQLHNILKKDSFFTFDKKQKYKRTILTLPGSEPVEKILGEYVLSLEEDHGFYLDNADYNIVYRSVHADYENLKSGHKEKNELTIYKEWFNEYKEIFGEALLDYWIKENKEVVDEFVDNFKFEYNKVAKTFGIDKI